MKFENIDDGIFRILIPFEGQICTTVYVVIDGEDVVLIDSATHPSDIDGYVLPSLAELGVDLERVGLLLLTHSHSDHAGGAARLMEVLPNLKLRGGFSDDVREGTHLAGSTRYSRLSDGERIGERLVAVALPGHTRGSFGFLDTKTKTLLAGDCLQQKGIGKYRNGVVYHDLYRESIEKLRKMDIVKVVSAHEYDPLGDIAEGREAVCELFDLCLEAIR